MLASTQSDRRAAYENYAAPVEVPRVSLVPFQGPGVQVPDTPRRVLTSVSWPEACPHRAARR